MVCVCTCICICVNIGETIYPHGYASKLSVSVSVYIFYKVSIINIFSAVLIYVFRPMYVQGCTILAMSQLCEKVI